MTFDLDVLRLARRQHGLVARPQLLALGATPHQIRGRVERGLWVRAAPRVYDVAPASPDPARPLHAALLATDGWASHRSAAWLLGLIDGQAPYPEIVLPVRQLPRGVDAVVHRSVAVDARDRVRVDGMWCTSVERTLLDLAAVLGPAHVDDALSRALTARRTSVRRLDHFLGRGLSGRRGVTALRESLDQFRDRRGEIRGLLEAIVNRAVADSRLPAPRRQHEVRSGRRRFLLDLAWPDRMVCVEADGLAFHASRTAFIHDRERQNLLVLMGWTVLRYTWAVATSEPGLILGQLGAALEASGRRGLQQRGA